MVKCKMSKSAFRCAVGVSAAIIVIFGLLGWAEGWKGVLIELGVFVGTGIFLGFVWGTTKIAGWAYDKFCGGIDG